MKFLLKSLAVIGLLLSSMIAQDIQIYTTDNSNGKITPKTIEKVFADAGFKISGNNDMNRAFNSKFKKVNHKVYNLFTLYKKDLVMELLKKSPKAALLAPLSMSIYTEMNSNTISVSSISLEGMEKVTGVSSKDTVMIKYANLIQDVLKKALPNGNFEKIPYKILKTKGELVTSFTAEMEAEGDDVEDELDGLQEELEGSLESVGFVIAGYNKLGDELNEVGVKNYDFFDAYSICKLPVIFEVAKLHPEAGAFAPCTFYMYKKKGSSDVTMAFPSVYNWLSSLGIEDKESTDVLIDAQKLFESTVLETIE